MYYLDLDLTRLPLRDSTLDGTWTRKPFGLSRVQPIYLSIAYLRYMSILLYLYYHLHNQQIICSIRLLFFVKMKIF